MESDTFVTVYVASDPNHAPVVESVLRDAGIWFVQRGEFTYAALGLNYPIGGPPFIQVRAEDVDRAHEALARVVEDFEPEFEL